MTGRMDGASMPSVQRQLEDRLRNFNFAFVITDPLQPDNPICFASPAFYELTGYSPADVINKNCRFLQGPETERRKVMEIRDAIREDRPASVCILNYKKNGEEFWNQLYLEPICDENQVVKHYVGIQTDVTTTIERAKAQGMLTEEADTMEDVMGVGTVESKRSMEIRQQLSGDLGTLNGATGPQCVSMLPASLFGSLSSIHQSFVLVDPNQPDMPIVHAGEGFLKMTGYPRHLVVGHNCRFLQGPDTDPDQVRKIRTAMTSNPAQPVTATLLNYRYDGTPFWNALHIAPIRGADGQVAYFVGVQLDVTKNYQKSCAAAAEGRKSVEANGHAEADSKVIPECGIVSGTSFPLKHKLAHSGTVGKVKVAVRSLSGGERGLRRERASCELPRRGSIDLNE